MVISKEFTCGYHNCNPYQYNDIWLVCQGEVLFKSIAFKTILILGWFCMCIEVLAWYIDLNGTEITKLPNIHTPMLLKKNEILVTSTQNIYEKMLPYQHWF